MEQTYKIIGITSGQGYKKLSLRPLENVVEEQEHVNPMEALQNFRGLVQKTNEMYMKQRNVDVIRVPDKVFNDLNLMIDGMFTIRY